MGMERVLKLAQRLASLDRWIARGEEVLKVLRGRRRYLAEFVVPEAVDQLDWDPEIMSYDPVGDVVIVKLPNGLTMMVAETFHPHTPKKDADKREAILDWVEANGGDALLTLDLTLIFRRGEGKKARAVLKLLDDFEKKLKKDKSETNPTLTLIKEKNIHHALYQTFCRDLVRKGKDLPEMLGVFNRRVASVVVPATPAPEPEPELPPRRVPSVNSQGYGDV